MSRMLFTLTAFIVLNVLGCATPAPRQLMVPSPDGVSVTDTGFATVAESDFVAKVKTIAKGDDDEGFILESEAPGQLVFRFRNEAAGKSSRLVITHKAERDGRTFTLLSKATGYGKFVGDSLDWAMSGMPYSDELRAKRNMSMIRNGMRTYFEYVTLASDATREADSSSYADGYSGGYSGGSSSRAGTDVYVKGYTRKDGTYVPAHTRARPGRGRK